MKINSTIIPTVVSSLIIWVIIGISAGYGQFLSNRTQLNHSPSIGHAAFTGIENQLSVDLAFRQAANAYGNGSGAYYAGLFIPMIRNKINRQNPGNLRLSNPELIQEEFNTKEAKHRQGIGLLLNQNELGHYKNLDFTIQYAYHLPISKKFFWSLAAGVSFQQHQLGLSNLRVRDEANDPLYQNIVNSNFGNQRYGVLDFSTAFYSENFFFAVSANNLTATSLGGSLGDSELYEGLRLEAYSGLRIPMGRMFFLQPTLQLTRSLLYDVQITPAVRIRYKNLLYVGASSEISNRYSALFGLKLPKDLFVHYSFDIMQNTVEDFSNGIHEISLSFLFNNKGQNLPFTW